MSLKKSVLSALIILSSTLSAHADQIGWGSPSRPIEQPSRPSQPFPPSNPRDPWEHQYESETVELNVQRYFRRVSSLDLLLDSYTRSQLLGQKVKEVKIVMAAERSGSAARVLANSRQIDRTVMVARQLREYTFTLDSFSNEVGRSLRSLSLEMQGSFYVDKVTFNISSSDDTIDPFPIPQQTEVLRQQINQTFEQEGGINLFRQFPLAERQGQIVKRITVVAMSRYSLGSAMLLKNSESFGQTQVISTQPTRVTFELRGDERLSRELQSLRLQFNGNITVLEVSIELEAADIRRR